MGFFVKNKRNKLKKLDFTGIDSKEKIMYLVENGILYPLYCMPLRFNGEDSEQNKLYVPETVVMLKDRYDDMVQDLLEQEKVNGYSCTPKYKGNSFVPSDITIVAKKDGNPVFTETIKVW